MTLEEALGLLKKLCDYGECVLAICPNITDAGESWDVIDVLVDGGAYTMDENYGVVARKKTPQEAVLSARDRLIDLGMYGEE